MGFRTGFGDGPGVGSRRAFPPQRSWAASLTFPPRPRFDSSTKRSACIARPGFLWRPTRSCTVTRNGPRNCRRCWNATGCSAPPACSPAIPKWARRLARSCCWRFWDEADSGRTFLATDPTLANRPVVVKVVPDDQEEHLALAQLRHTHIVPLFSEHSFPERNLRGLCMPYLGGTTLLQVFDDLASVPWSQRTGKHVVESIDRNTHPAPALPRPDGPFRRSLEEASHVEALTWIAACLAEALHYAHERGLVHMDLKPSNVLITLDGQPMLLDFHLAQAHPRRAMGLRPSRRNAGLDVSRAGGGHGRRRQGRAGSRVPLTAGATSTPWASCFARPSNCRPPTSGADATAVASPAPERRRGADGYRQEVSGHRSRRSLFQCGAAGGRPSPPA